MTEQDVIGHLLGPNGGTFALGLLCGSVLMWFANLKVVNPYIQRAHTAEMDAMRKQIALLENRINALEQTEKAYHSLLVEHSKRTLHPGEQS